MGGAAGGMVGDDDTEPGNDGACALSQLKVTSATPRGLAGDERRRLPFQYPAAPPINSEQASNRSW